MKKMTLLKLSKLSFKVGFIFWLIETIVFQFIYGLHWYAFAYYEMICDRIVSGFFTFGCVLFIDYAFKYFEKNR